MFLRHFLTSISHFLVGQLVWWSVQLSVTKLFKGCFSQFKDILNVFECFNVTHTPLKATFWSASPPSVHPSICPLCCHKVVRAFCCLFKGFFKCLSLFSCLSARHFWKCRRTRLRSNDLVQLKITCFLSPTYTTSMDGRSGRGVPYIHGPPYKHTQLHMSWRHSSQFSPVIAASESLS